jgi:spermidine synthase
VALLFFASGLAALVDELIWIRGFSFVLGNTTQAMASVLAAFMAGLALGYALAGRLAQRSRSPLAAYGALEIGIGLSSLVVLWFLQRYSDSPVLWQALGRPAWMNSLAGLSFTAAVLLVPTALMGATFPLLLHLDEGQDRAGASSALFYGLNTLGAALGAFLAGFFMLRLWGMQLSAQAAAAVNLSAGVIALSLSLWMGSRRPGPAVGPAPKLASAPGEGRWILTAFFLAGAASLGYEIVFSRFLTYTVGNRVFAASTILTVYLGAMALGSLASGCLIDRFRCEQSLFNGAQLGIGLWGCLGAAWAGPYVAWAQAREAALKLSGVWPTIGFKFSLAALVLFPPAFLAGAAFPAALRSLSRGRPLADGAGRAAAINTLGCITGSLLTGFVLIPLCGAWTTLLLIGLLSLALGHRILAPDWDQASRALKWASVGLTLILGAWLTRNALQQRAYPFARPGLELVSAQEDASALFSVWTGPLGHYIYGDNSPLSYPMGPHTKAESVQRLQAVLPLLLRPQAKRALVVGLGFGTASGAMASCGSLDSVDTVELIPGLIQAMPLFAGYNNDLLHLQRSALHLGDGRHFLKDPPYPYDIIATNLTDADLPGSASCYTREYLLLARRGLAEHGLFLLHFFGSDHNRDILLKTVASVFPHVEAYRAYKYSFFIVAGMESAQPKAKELDRRLRQYPALALEARKAGVRTGQALLALRRLNEAEVQAIAAREDLPLNTDDLPVVEYGMDKAAHLFRAKL